MFNKRMACVGLVIAASASLYTMKAWSADVPGTTPAVTPPPAAVVPFFLFTDTRGSFSYLPKGSGPGAYSINPNGSINGKTSQEIASITHFDVWKYGTNFLDIDAIFSGHNDPALGCAFPNPGTCQGALNIYGVTRSTFGLNEITNSKRFKVGPLSNVSLEVGSEFGTKNVAIANETKYLMGGLQFRFDLPYQGYFTFAPMAAKQWDHSSFNEGAPPLLPGGNLDYRVRYVLEGTYSLPLDFLPERVRFFTLSGYATFYAPKGSETGLPGGTPTKVEMYTEPARLTFDAGSAFMGKANSHAVDLWVAYKYWQNKYGLDAAHSTVCITNGQSNGTCTESSVRTGVSVRF